MNGAGTSDVAPAGFRYNPELGVVDVRGRNLAQTKKFGGTDADFPGPDARSLPV